MVAPRPALPRPLAPLLGGVLCAGLLGASLSPAWGDAGGGAGEDGSGAARLGGFALGDALEGLVDEGDGSMRVELPIGPLRLAWDSGRVGADRGGFGPGIDLDVTRVSTTGGVRVSPRTGGSFELDADSPSGLLGYPGRDVQFRPASGELDARPGAPTRGGDADGDDDADGRVGYRFVLRELGGSTTYFDHAGDPVAQITADGGRTDYHWSPTVHHRLLAFVDPDGVVTELDWRGAPDTVVVRAGTNLGVPARAWRLEPDGGGWSVEDPVGETVHLRVDASGLVSRIDTASGASTQVSWLGSADAAPRVAELRTVDSGSGAELSVRRWTSSSGVSVWPARDPAWHPLASTQSFTTTLTDGRTRVHSDYDAARRLTGRRIEVAVPSGTRIVREQSYAYPAGPRDRGAAADSAAADRRPSRTSVTHTDERGRTRTTVEEYAFDDVGRATRRVDAAGTITEHEYAPQPADSEALPSALPVRTRATAGDGLIAESRFALDASGTVVLAEETFTGPAAGPLTRTGRTEYDVDGGFVRRADGTTFEYDHLGRPVRETTPDGRDLTTDYWADGTRKRIATSSAAAPVESVTFHWDGDTLLTETHTAAGGAAGTASYLIGSSRSARTTTALDGTTDTTYFVEDRHGNVTALADAEGAIRLRYAYSDYGVATATPAGGAASAPAGALARNPFQFANEFTEETGAQRLGERAYHPSLMRFSTPDPTPLHSRHGFANANPITNVDPSGLDAISDLVNGLTIAFTAVMALGTLGASGITGGASLGLLGVIGLTADVAGIVTGVVQIVDDRVGFMPRHVKQGLTYAEYGFAGFGLVGLASAVPELARRGLYGWHLRGLQREIPDYLTGRLHRLGDFEKSPAYDWLAKQRPEGITGELHTSAMNAIGTDGGIRKALDAVETPWQDARLPGGDLIDALVTAQRAVHQVELSIGVAKTTLLEIIDLASDLAPATKTMYKGAVGDGMFQLGSHPDRFRHLLALKTGGPGSARRDEWIIGADWGGHTTATERDLLLTDD